MIGELRSPCTLIDSILLFHDAFMDTIVTLTDDCAIANPKVNLNIIRFSMLMNTRQ